MCDQGQIFITISPSPENPLFISLQNIRSTRPVGVVPPNTYSLVPIIINFKSLKPIHPETEEKIHRLFILKIQSLIRTSIDNLIGKINEAEKWTDVVTDAHLQTHETSTFIKMEYGEVVRAMLEIIVSELIQESNDWEKKYLYKVDVTRTDMDIMLIGSCPGPLVMTKFQQRIFEENIQVSARRWNIGISFKRVYVWKQTWAETIKNIV
jgi:hypothetical protein